MIFAFYEPGVHASGDPKHYEVFIKSMSVMQLLVSIVPGLLKTSLLTWIISLSGFLISETQLLKLQKKRYDAWSGGFGEISH
jgi:hypothetical protein